MASFSALREIRLFVSSTFRDLEQERHQLVLDAFPRLRLECSERGVAFTEIDLRWGITDNEARAYRVLQVCLEEVDRCANFPPFFVGILGNRYGWIPEQADWDNARDLEAILPKFSDCHKGESITELEIQFGVLERGDMIEHSFFYFPNAQGPRDPKQEHLKQLIRTSGAHFREDIATPEELSEWVVNDLTAAIERLFPKKNRPTRTDQIVAAQEIHARQMAISHIPMPELLEDWLAAIEACQCICLYGESGTGKSAFLAALANEIHERRPEYMVFTHYVGVGDSRTRYTWMTCLFHWARECGLTQLELPKTNAEIQAQLPLFLSAIGASVTVVIVIDAIDQLDDGGIIDEWLPVQQTKNIHWVVSTTDPQQMQTCERLGWDIRSLPPLNPNRAMKLVENGLERYKKRLPEHLLARCINHPMSSRPLFLKVLYEELRLHGKHETLEDYLNSLLDGSTVQTLFECMLNRISLDFGIKSVEVLALIGISKHGASEPELRAILNLRTWDVSRVIMMALPYLGSHQGLLSPFHEGFRRALIACSNETGLKEVWCSYWRQSQDVQRRFEEYPSALAKIEAWEDIYAWIFSAETLAFAWENNSVDELVSWYAEVVAKGPTRESFQTTDMTAWPLAALHGLKEFAYQVGNRELEETALMAQQGIGSINKCTWLIDRSLLHYRRGQQSAATDLAHQAIDSAKSPREGLDSNMNLIQMLAFGDAPAQALEISRQISRDSVEILRSDIEAEAYLCQYTSFACHFLDLNNQSCVQSKRAAELYGALGRRYDQGISWVNAGDGAWGAGMYTEAEEYFDKALGLASTCRLPHVEDIATICLANLRMSQMRLEEAAALYEDGISLAQRIGQDWDVLYGKIYQALTLGLLGKGHEGMQRLAREADNGGYRYLSDLATAYRLVLTEGEDGDWRGLADSPFPGPRAYALAFGIINGQKLKPILKQLLESTEGIKGPSDFIKRTLANNTRLN